MRVPLIANKDMTYGTRRLKADDSFDAPRNEARILVGLKRARLVEDPQAVVAPKEPAAPRASKKATKESKAPAEPGKAPDGELAALRASYTEKFGKKPFNGWNAATLSEKLAADA